LKFSKHFTDSPLYSQISKYFRNLLYYCYPSFIEGEMGVFQGKWLIREPLLSN